MSYGDSEAVFEQRALHMGLSEATLKLLKDKGYKTMALFAFSCNYAPGAASDKPFTDMIAACFQREPTAVELSILRRLFNESYANVAADIRSQVEQTDESTSRKLAPAERAERLKEQQQRLVGIEIRGQYEPGDTLVDKCCACYEADRLVYIEWSSCISREFELSNNVKKDSSLTFTSEGILKLAKTLKPEPVQAVSEIQIRYCLVRRGLALEQANIMSYKNHDRWAELLMECRMNESPSGYQRVSLKQLELADKKFFTLMSEHTRGGIKSGPAGRPCDLHFDAVFNAPEVRHLLQPRLGQNIGQAASSRQDPSDSQPTKKAKVDKKGRGKGKQENFQRVPTDLLKLGGVASTPKGHRICFGYNLQSCSQPVKQQKCERGLHVCCIRNCHRAHPATECPSKQE